MSSGLPVITRPESAGASRHPAASAPELLLADECYPCPRNPLVTTAQKRLEAMALRVMQTPVVRRARDEVARRWKILAGPQAPAEAWSRFDELVEEFAFNDVLKAVNSDANHPQVLGMLWAPPREWMGQRLPGSRGSGGDGPDNHYALIPVDGAARFEINGQRFDPAPADVPFTLIGNSAITITLAMLEWRDIVCDDDGRFVITLGPEPADGRHNHIQTPVDARYLFVRSCRADWRQIPVALSVRRLDPPTRAPLSEDEMAALAARSMIDNVVAMYWFMRVFENLPANAITAPFCTGEISGLVTQMISFLRLELADDEAYVVTISAGDAAFRDIVLHDYWFRTIDYWKYQTSLNNAQGRTDAAGNTTYVICAQDPGVHNWLDTRGLRHLLVVHRWQAMPRDPDRAPPQTQGRRVKLHELAAALPPDITRVTPEQRGAQLRERQASYQLRLIDQ